MILYPQLIGDSMIDLITEQTAIGVHLNLNKHGNLFYGTDTELYQQRIKKITKSIQLLVVQKCTQKLFFSYISKFGSIDSYVNVLTSNPLSLTII